MIKFILRIVYIALMGIEALILARIILNIFNANFSNVYAGWIKNTSEIFISPFSGIMAESIKIESLVISLTPFVALIFYIIGGFIISELLKAFSKE